MKETAEMSLAKVETERTQTQIDPSIFRADHKETTFSGIWFREFEEPDSEQIFENH